MEKHQLNFIRFAIERKVLCFGSFTLKSGRQSPYFFNSGLFNDGASLAQLGRYYAEAIKHHDLQFDMLYGPAYKGIPLASSAAIALADHQDTNVPYAFNRKEAKDHGEGGNIVGAALKGDILIIDDVISAGTSVRESIEIIKNAGATPKAVIIALDRQEVGTNDKTAIQEVEQDYGLRVASIISLEHLIEFLETNAEYAEHVDAIKAYRQQYGAS